MSRATTGANANEASKSTRAARAVRAKVARKTSRWGREATPVRGMGTGLYGDNNPSFQVSRSRAGERPEILSGGAPE
ncbi:MAG: hypothetical protein ACK55Z_26080 [bacterium]